jgi:hypothetical protein
MPKDNVLFTFGDARVNANLSVNGWRGVGNLGEFYTHFRQEIQPSLSSPMSQVKFDNLMPHCMIPRATNRSLGN